MIRFSHEANSWQTIRKNHRWLVWDNISVEDARKLVDSGYTVIGKVISFDEED
jgi:hypothetical protein